jgi:hypothetical protein
MSQLLELSAARDKSFFKNGACRDEFVRVLLLESQRSAPSASSLRELGALDRGHAEVQPAVFAQVITDHADRSTGQQNYCNDFPVQNAFLL